ncbi:MAG TPA: replication-associated recombination protein A [Candidatus Nanoarchaeia archaeon]|nr:replication-associated recombination protein A [Candidatus Nanoarchaeia archaeon]
MSKKETKIYAGMPLAARLRPKDLGGFVGQEKVIKPGSFLYKAIESDEVPSLIFWGPPGSGKTTLAAIIANLTRADFIEFSAVESGKSELKEVIKRAEENKRLGQKTILFIDEIHRWNKAQQDALLPHVERGTLILIGATTENPSFAVNSALLSRTKVVVLERLTEEELKKIIKRGAEELKVKISEDTLSLIAHLSNGDARTGLNILEACSKVITHPVSARRGATPLNRGDLKKITDELVKEVIAHPNLLYDKTGEEHYNIISALHKSMRGGDADAALYWLARMLVAGEDPMYIIRRLVRFASEDVGLANNSALMLATSVWDACKNLGLPECKVHLAQLVIYLAKSPKSIDAYLAYGEAEKDATELGNLQVPLAIRNAPTKLMKDLDYGKGYKYTPLEDSTGQEYFPPELRGRKYLKSKK